MPKRINPKILHAEIKEKIGEFYPYFLGFYILSLAVTYLHPAWSGFFYWPAFHGAAIIFTALFLLTIKFNLRERYSSGHILKNIRSMMVLAAGSFVIINRLIKERIRLVPRRAWAKIVIIAVIMIFAALKGIGAVGSLVLCYALVSFLFVLDSRWSAAIALALLASCPVLLILKKPELWAENVAIYAYYFLVITVLTQIRELKRNKLAVDKSDVQ